MKLGLMSVIRARIVSTPILHSIVITPVSTYDYRSSIRRVFLTMRKLISNEVELPVGNVLFPHQDSYTIKSSCAPK